MSAVLIHQETRTTTTRTATTEPAAPAQGGPLRRAWHRLRAAVADMNYAARRVAEVQAPWLAGGR